jgi:hypothetical protein
MVQWFIRSPANAKFANSSWLPRYRLETNNAFHFSVLVASDPLLSALQSKPNG